MAKDERETIFVVLGNAEPVDHVRVKDASAADVRRAREALAVARLAGEDTSGLSAAERKARKAAVVESIELDPEERIRVRLDAKHQGYKRRATVVAFPDDVGPREALATITEPERGVWSQHSDAPPAWVASTSPGLASFLAEEYGCEVRELDRGDLNTPTKSDERKGRGTERASGGEGREERQHHRAARREDRPHRGRGLGPIAGVMLTFALLALYLGQYLRTDAGKDFQSRVMGDTASTGTGAYAAATFIGLSASTVAPAAASTALPGEITTVGGGLLRAQAAYAHTLGASTYTLTKTFTTNTSDVLPVTIAKIGVLNAATGGTLVFETLLNATATLNASGDQLTVTETVTI